MRNISKGRDRLLLFAAAFLFSTGGAAIKACSMTTWQVASFRSGIAAAVLLLLIPESRRNWNYRTLGIGCAYAATMIAFVAANKLTSATNAIFLEYTAPVYMLLLAPVLLGEKIRRSDLAVFSGVALGAVLLLEGSSAPSAGATNPARGNLFALASGLTWALTMTGLRWLSRGDASEGSATATVVTGNLIAFAVCLPFALPVHEARVTDIAIVAYIGVFQIGLAYVCLTRSIRRVPAFEATTLLLLEPVFNPLWTWIVHGERPGALAITGGIFILSAALGGIWWQSHKS